MLIEVTEPVFQCCQSSPTVENVVASVVPHGLNEPENTKMLAGYSIMRPGLYWAAIRAIFRASVSRWVMLKFEL